MTDQLSGTIERVTFHNPDNGFIVLRVEVRGQRGPVVVVRQTPRATPGEFVEATGKWVEDTVPLLRNILARFGLRATATPWRLAKESQRNYQDRWLRKRVSRRLIIDEILCRQRFLCPVLFSIW